MLTRRHLIASASAGIVVSACASSTNNAIPAADMKTIGVLDSFDKRFDALIAPNTPIEIVAEGFDWSEGPAWDKKRNRLLFSDVPQNKIYSWSHQNGLEIFLEPAGAPHDKPYAHASRGSNGLWYDKDDTLLICNQSGRSIDRLNLSTGKREILADTDNGTPLNRPNDLIAAQDGTIYFTNPPFGLNDKSISTKKFLSYNAVYKVDPNGKTSIITKELDVPNGIALSPDESILYVAQSGKDAPRINRYHLNSDGSVHSSDVFVDFKNFLREGVIPSGDGMAIDRNGNIFVGVVDAGLYVFSPEGQLLGGIYTGRKMSNCIFGDDGSVLYVTADDLILRIQTGTKGLYF